MPVNQPLVNLLFTDAGGRGGGRVSAIFPNYTFFSCRKDSSMYRQHRIHHTEHAVEVSVWHWRNSRPRSAFMRIGGEEGMTPSLQIAILFLFPPHANDHFTPSPNCHLSPPRPTEIFTPSLRQTAVLPPSPIWDFTPFRRAGRPCASMSVRMEPVTIRDVIQGRTEFTWYRRSINFPLEKVLLSAAEMVCRGKCMKGTRFSVLSNVGHTWDFQPCPKEATNLGLDRNWWFISSFGFVGLALTHAVCVSVCVHGFIQLFFCVEHYLYISDPWTVVGLSLRRKFIRFLPSWPA